MPRTAVRAQAEHASDAAALLRLTNQTLYGGSAGGHLAVAAVALIDPETAAGTVAVAGNVAVHLLGRDCSIVPVPRGPELASDPEASYLSWPFSLKEDASLICCLTAARCGEPGCWDASAAQVVGLQGVRSGDLASKVRGSVPNQSRAAAGLVVRASSLDGKSAKT